MRHWRAQISRGLGYYEAALAEPDDVIPIQERVSGPANHLTLTMRATRVQLLGDLRRYEEALNESEDQLAI